eukprot:5876523-Prymnesium_polylepis.1
MVYRYKYCEELLEHGGVLVQYKSNIQWMGNCREASGVLPACASGGADVDERGRRGGRQGQVQREHSK